MLFTCIVVFLLNSFLFQSSRAQPASCITCINCQDVYDGTDMNSTCSSTVANANSCQKLRIQLPGTVLVAKACARTCNSQSIVAGPVRFDVSCCNTTNCNTATSNILLPMLLWLPATITTMHFI